MTKSLSIELPTELLDFVETRVREGRFETANEYIVALVEIARRKRSSLELALVDTLDDEVQEWSQEEVEAMKQRLIERHGANNSSG